MVASGCSNNPAATTVRISAENEGTKRNNAEIRTKKKTQIATITEKNGKDKVKPGMVINEYAQTSAERKEQNTPNNPDKPYEDIVAFPKTGAILLFKSRNYKVSVSIGFNSPRMRPIVCVFDAGDGPKHHSSRCSGPKFAGQYTP